MNFANICIALGLGYGLPQLYAIINPEAYKASLKKLPRSIEIGWLLTLISTAWFLYNVHLEEISDFAPYKKFMLAGFGALGICACIFLRDFLAIRGFALFILLLAKLVCDTGRWVETPLRLLVITWAYVWICAGIWWTVSPWRGRDWVDWNIADDGRLKLLSVARLVFALVLIALGATVFRG